MSVLVVHDTPIKSGHHLTILNSIFRAFKTDYEIVSIVPKMSDKELKKIKPERWLQESDRVWEAAAQHEKILCCGPIATATVHRLEKTIAVTKARGRGMLAEGKYTIATYSPSTVVKDQDFFRDVVFDISKLLTHSEPIPQPDVEVRLIEKKADLRDIRSLHDAPHIGMDIETTGFGIHAYPLSVGLGVSTGTNCGLAFVVPQKYIGPDLLTFFKTYKGYSVYHNLKFDIQHLMRLYGTFRFLKPMDTMLLNYSLDERPFNRYRSHSLKLLARLYYDAPDYGLPMGEWLEEYFRVDPDPGAVQFWQEEHCIKYPEKSRTYWRKGYEAEFGEEPSWRGLKVGRDIHWTEVAKYLPLPKTLLPAATKARKKEMLDELYTYQGLDAYYTARLFPDLCGKQEEECAE